VAPRGNVRCHCLGRVSPVKWCHIKTGAVWGDAGSGESKGAARGDSSYIEHLEIWDFWCNLALDLFGLNCRDTAFLSANLVLGANVTMVGYA